MLCMPGREEMGLRAAESFAAQTYKNKLLSMHPVEPGARTIGEERNLAISSPYAAEADIIVHFDDDDWSHPHRIAEQVELLQTSGAEVVGYREMLFWRSNAVRRSPGSLALSGEAWLYRNMRLDYAVGTSLCYWRETWKARRFPSAPRKPGATGEDVLFTQGRKVVTGTSSIHCMIASLHGGNSQPYDPENSPVNWTRVPEWDDFCRTRMAL